jgi:predicted amidophosphoribosyltransferase
MMEATDTITASVGAITVLAPLTPLRCAGCRHPATGELPACAVCGRSLRDAWACSRDDYRASRADDATLPTREGR